MGGIVPIFKKRTSVNKALVAMILIALLVASVAPAQALATGAATKISDGISYSVKGSEGEYGAGVYIEALVNYCRLVLQRHFRNPLFSVGF